ncbi:GTP-binding protein [Pseudothauera nasutitermitis]|uniref:GTP-binding protein n=1 Tax=Pseudothauera nasutitermitis TaxID=2565930 RepID=A0A4S4AWG6_9RHOO|nr:AAA family ATPase [Pseudothauera nasutitermitis]THF62948.1 GTP-binding protein [Pseudothauera nasutitermitis]
MKLTRLRVEQFRQFRAPLEIRDFAPGINLFAGPNEAGKSTLAAALRAAFFERHRSSSVEYLRPWGDSAAAPTVEVDFELGGQSCRLVKTFLARKRCTLQIGNELLDGAQAEDRLAELLGFQHAGRGESRAEHWGIPGLLWIEQGGAHSLREAVGHAADHLRAALDASLGEVAASGGDGVLAEVRALRAELLTEAGGRPRGAYKEALERQERLAAELETLDAAIEQYRQRVDALAVLRREQAADEAQRPWETFRTRQREAAASLEAVQVLERERVNTLRQQAEAEQRATLWRSQVEADAREKQALADRAGAEEAARARWASAQAAVAPWQAGVDAANGELQRVRADLARARGRDARARLEREAAAAQTQAEVLARRLKEAEQADEDVRTLRQRAAVLAVPADLLAALRQGARELAELDIRRSAAATRVRYALLSGQQLRLGAETLHGDGERELLEATALELPGVGRVDIQPGGSDLAELRARIDRLHARQSERLRTLGLASPEAVEARVLEHAGLLNELTGAQARLQALAESGIEALRGECAAQHARADELANALHALPPAAEDGAGPPVEEAEAAEQAALRALAGAQESLQQARLAEADARARLEAASREHATARQAYEAPARARALAGARAGLTDALAQGAELARRAEALHARIAEAHPDILRQDVERYRASADQQEQQYRARRDDILRLEAALQAEGAQGQDERRAELARDLAQARRRADELGRRASALDLLHGLLDEQRQRLTRRLRAPLQARMEHYLRLLFPQASVDIGEDLAPASLLRPASGDVQGGSVDELSFGAREQMGVIGRLAYADLLAEAGRPTLILLDDALVHSDDERLARMKRVLFDAATRHQILLFTCHPEDWRDLGVTARDLQALRAG